MKGKSRGVQRAGELVTSKDNRGDVYWRTVAANKQVLAGSTEGYKNRGDMQTALVTSTAIQFAALSPRDREWVQQYADERDAQANML